MKKNMLFLAVLSASLCFSFNSLAADVNLISEIPEEEIETVDTEQKEYLEEAPWEYGEMKDGLFVRRTVSDELSWLERSDERYCDEMIKVWEARKMEELTPEMEAEGWVLVNGNPTPPEEAEGERSAEEIQRENQEKELSNLNEITTYDENGNPVVNYGYGYVSFIGTVQPDIHETCFIEVTNTSSKKTYLFELYEPNSYNTAKQLPEGTYIISDGGIPNDYKSEYPIKGNNFIVKSGSATIVKFTIGDVNEDEVKNGIVVEINESEEIVEEISEEKEAKTVSPFVTFLIYITSIILIAGFVYLIYIIFKRHSDIEK